MIFTNIEPRQKVYFIFNGLVSRAYVRFVNTVMIEEEPRQIVTLWWNPNGSEFIKTFTDDELFDTEEEANNELNQIS